MRIQEMAQRTGVSPKSSICVIAPCSVLLDQLHAKRPEIKARIVQLEKLGDALGDMGRKARATHRLGHAGLLSPAQAEVRDPSASRNRGVTGETTRYELSSVHI
jgi:hypothetical protein